MEVLKSVALTQTVEWAGRQVVVKEMSTRQIMKMASVLEGVFADAELLPNLTSGDTERALKGLTKLIQTVPDKLAEIVVAATDLTTDDVLDAPPRLLVELIKQIWELNNLTNLLKKKAPTGVKATTE